MALTPGLDWAQLIPMHSEKFILTIFHKAYREWESLGSRTVLDQVTVGMAEKEAILRRDAASIVCVEQLKKLSENMALYLLVVRKDRGCLQAKG